MTDREQELAQLLERATKTNVTRRGFLAGAGFAGLSAFLAACSSGGSSSSGTVASAAPSASAAAASAAAPSAAASGGIIGGTGQTEGALYMYNWANYIDEGNIKRFRDQYGVSDWSYDTFASNDEMFTTLQGGKVGQWDVAAPTADLIPALIQNDFIQKIDWSKVPNAKYINSNFLKQWWDPKDEYNLAKDWGTTGITVRTKDVKEPVKTWKDFFALAPKYSGKIVVVDSSGDVFAAALKSLGYSVNSEDTAQLEEVRKLLMDFAPHVLALNSDTYEVPLGNEEAVLGLTWTGGVADLRKDPATADTVYIIPEDGTLFWVDTWVLLQDAPHPQAAHAWLNFIQDPQVQAIETETNQYASPNDEARKYIPKEILDDTTIYVPEDILNSGKLETAKDLSQNQQRVDIWQEFSSKIGG